MGEKEFKEEVKSALWEWMGRNRIYSFLMMEIIFSYAFWNKKSDDENNSDKTEITLEDLDNALMRIPSSVPDIKHIDRCQVCVMLNPLESEYPTNWDAKQYLKVYERLKSPNSWAEANLNLCSYDICTFWNNAWIGKFNFPKFFQGIRVIRVEKKWRDSCSEIHFVFGDKASPDMEVLNEVE